MTLQQIAALPRSPITPGRYVEVKTPTGGWVREHVLIASVALGRRLPEGAHVHHVDGNKTNNANSNLVICQDQSYHRLLHARARVVAAGGNPNTDAVCSRCLLAKRLDEFYRNRAQSHGRTGACRACTRATNRETRARHRDRINAARRVVNPHASTRRWPALLDGERHILRRGVDYRSTLRNFQSWIGRVAKRRGLAVALRQIDADSIELTTTQRVNRAD